MMISPKIFLYLTGFRRNSFGTPPPLVALIYLNAGKGAGVPLKNTIPRAIKFSPD